MAESHRARYRFTVADVVRMLEAGILHDVRVELLGGDLIEMNAQGPQHSRLTIGIRQRLTQLYGEERFHVQDHSPVQMSDEDLPEPDIALVRGPLRLDLEAYPRGEDILLVVEIAATTLRHDRTKAAVYARGGVPEYWIVDVEGRRLEVHRKPQPLGKYAERLDLDEHATVSWPEIDETVAVQDLLPPA